MSMASLRYACVNAESVLADLNLVPVAYRVLYKVRAYSEPGGLVHLDQAAIAELLGLSRATVNSALRDLDLAQILSRVRNGVYQINPMLASYLTDNDCQAAIARMPAKQRLTHPDFIEQYHRNQLRYQDQLAEQRRKRKAKADREAAVVARRRGAMHAVGS